jgi:hypothetical protein
VHRALHTHAPLPAYKPAHQTTIKAILPITQTTGTSPRAVRSGLFPPSFPFDSPGPRTFSWRRLSRPHLHRVLRRILRPTHCRRFKRQQGAWRAAVAVRQPPRAVCRPEREWFMHSHSSQYGYPPTQMHATGSPTTVRYHPNQPLVPSVSQKVIWCVSIALGSSSSSYLCAPRSSISLILDLIALPTSPTSPSPTQHLGQPLFDI